MSQLILPRPRLTQLETEVIHSCLKQGKVTFASGESANNHLDLGYEDIPKISPLKRRLGVLTTGLVLQSGVMPDFIATVPTGADGWGDMVTARLNDPQIARIKSIKVGRRQFANSDLSAKSIAKLKNTNVMPHGIVIDDATTDGGTTEAYADFLAAQGLTVDLAMSLFYRGNLSKLKSKYNRAVVLAHYIPLMIDWDTFEKTGRITELGSTTE